jgi:N utilization substance protein B
MALQMLYQRDLGQRSVDEILEHFDFEGQLADVDAALLEGPRIEDLPEGARLLPEAPPPQPVVQGPAKARKSFEYACRLVRGVSDHGEAIDEAIRRRAENWRLERMPTIDRSILRLAVYEMNWEKSVPKVVIVDEAIELAKKFGSENSGRFVNGLLDGILQAESTLVPATDHEL